MYNGVQYSSQFYPSGPMNMQQLYDTQCYPSPPASPLQQFPQSPEFQRPPTHLEQWAPNIVQEKILGTGAYGTVYLVRDVMTGMQYAVKALNKFVDGRPVDLRTQQFQRTEMKLHYEASAHPNVVSLLRVLNTPTITYVFLEYCPEGDLFTNITEYQRYYNNPNDAKTVFLQVLDAVAHCHSLGIYHRDLKPENILVTQNGNQVKLADFGLATTEPVSKDFGCGSTFYMSPECHDTSASKPFYACGANDVWSLGVILVNLTCGRNPWKVADAKKDSTYKAFRGKPDFLKEILPISDDLNDILKRIFTKDPSQRITLPELRARIYECMSFSPVEVPLSSPVVTQQQYYNVPSYQTPFVTHNDLILNTTYAEDHGFVRSSSSSADSVFSHGSSRSSQSSVPSLSGSDCDDAASIASEEAAAVRQHVMSLPKFVKPLAAAPVVSGMDFLSSYTSRVAMQGLGIQHLITPFFQHAV